ncbi:MAG: prolyl oligopeptidase family serine peptidase [Acidobacteria bacterium]|nr:prolyl oligopeptidase family serine peptidase [Acidobacteriota bacterium]
MKTAMGLILGVAFLVAAPVVAQETSAERRIEEVRFSSGQVELAGRLWLPPGPGPHPAVVFLPGSGQSIRNLDLDPDPIPYHFADHGVAYLAWDKRGVRDSGGEFIPLPDTNASAQEDRLRVLAGDAVAAMRYLATRRDVDAARIGAWAFSQGGWVAPLLEAVGGEPAFVIVVGGPAVTIGEELRYSELADAARQRSRDGGGAISMPDLYQELEQARGAGADFGGFDPARHWKNTTAPTLFLLGEWDLSVPTARSVERLERLSATSPWIDYRVFPRATHGVAERDAAGQSTSLRTSSRRNTTSSITWG